MNLRPLMMLQPATLTEASNEALAAISPEML